MKLVTYCWKGHEALGALVNHQVVDLRRAYAAALRHDGDADELAVAELRVPGELLGLLRGGEASMAAAWRALQFVEEQWVISQTEGLCYPLAEVDLLAPIQRPGKVVCVGLNYRSHLKEIGEPTPEYPILFHKAATSLIGHRHSIVLPRISRQVDYEGELAIVIGCRGKTISEHEALAHVAGYTCANDVSAHDLEFRTSQWTSGKMLDTFCPLGPVLLTRDEISDPGYLRLRTILNGQTVQDAWTSDMIFSVPFLISYISSLATLEPGDLILTGTPAGIGCNQKPQVFLQPGDEISVQIDGIGTLTNLVVPEGGAEAMRHWTAERLLGQSESIWEKMNALARRYDAVNLGSGTPDMPVPDGMQTALQEAVAAGHNQYSPVKGEAALRAAVAEHAARFYGQEIDPTSEISITTGVTEGVYAAVSSFINPGDEVIVFEPFYDCYVPSIRLAGGIPRAVTLHAPSFRFVPEELRAAFSSRTRAILLNTPHNPTGIVFSRSELTNISELCQEFDVLAITDEVYEHIVFDGGKHVRLATLPGMWERTLTLSGAGKTFSCTGWRIGWAIGPAPLQEALSRLRQCTVFAAATPLQLAVAAGLRFPDSYFRQLAADYETRRDFLVATLADCGLKPTAPAGSFFILTDISSRWPGNCRDFCQDLARTTGVVPVPTETFYLHEDHGKTIVRFTFCVHRQMLEKAAMRLAKFQSMCGVER